MKNLRIISTALSVFLITLLSSVIMIGVGVFTVTWAWNTLCKFIHLPKISYAEGLAVVIVFSLLQGLLSTVFSKKE